MLLLLVFLIRFIRRRLIARTTLRGGVPVVLLIGIASLVPGNDPAAAVTRVEPELPRVLLDTEYIASSGKTIAVNSGGDLQAALKAARPGDVISLQAGATFIGNFSLPPKSGSGWIVIRSSTSDGKLPAPGTRVSPKFASLMPKILTPNADPALLTTPGAHHYRFIGIEIGIKPGVPTNYGIVRLGDSSKAQTDLAIVPHDIIIDRCYIHGNATGDVSRGIALNSGRTAIIDSYISDCHGVGFDTQAICGWNGPGPFKIVNNYLEGAGENFMLGGADPSISKLTPTDIEFRHNHLRKPLHWKKDDTSFAKIRWSVKNLFELKNARRVLIDSNVFENNWVDAQNGFAILFTPRNDEGTAPWSLVEDVTFTNNVVRHSAGGVNIHGRDNIHPSEQAKRIKIKNNLFDDIGGVQWGRNGVFLQISDCPNVTVDHNTVIHTGNVITAHGAPSPDFVFSNNIMRHNEYGVIGDGVGVGNVALKTYFPLVSFTNNILIGGQKANYPGGNKFPVAWGEIGFTDRENSDFRLTKTSSYKGTGSDGKDPGCDFDIIEQMMIAVIQQQAVK